MNLKLIDLDWIEKKLQWIEEEDIKLMNSWEATNEQKIQGGIHSGVKVVLNTLKEQLISPTEEIKKTFEAGAHAFNNAMDSLDYDKEFNSELEKYLKRYESDNI